jgi:hypothetical protein
MNNELERIWNETVIASCKILPPVLAWMIENYRLLLSIDSLWQKI